MLGRTDSRVRLVFLLGFLAIFASALGLRLAYWQIGQAEQLRILGDQQLSQPVQAQVARGQITDRRGTVLATTSYRDVLAAYPDLMTDDEKQAVAARLTGILGLGATQSEEVSAALEPNVPYVVLARRLTPAQSELIRAGLADESLVALDLEPQPVRFYPNDGGSPGTTLASQLLGFVTDDGRGRYGIEQYSQDILATESGATAGAGGDVPLPHAGADIELTIDASLQLRLEKELYAAWVADRAQRVTGMVMDPYTGAVLAWASVPGYNANEYPAAAERAPELFADPIVSQVYEPGSVMKVLTAAAALEQGVVTLETPIDDDKLLRIGTNVVRNGDLRSIGTAPFQDQIARSRNVATGKVALMLGETPNDAASVLYDMWERLGIGRQTGIDLGGESVGLVANPEERPWHQIDIVNRAFGQGVAVTPIQLATAYSAMVNGGDLPVPHVISAAGGEPVDHPRPAQVMDQSLSDDLRRLMVHVVDAGPNYASETLIPGYVVGGKTGTAQIWDNRAGQWKENVYNHTFVGFVGAQRPEAVILVRIHETEPRIRRRWGMSLELTSNELFRRVALDTISVLDIPPLPGSEPAEPTPTITPSNGQPPPPDRPTRTPTPDRPRNNPPPPTPAPIAGWH